MDVDTTKKTIEDFLLRHNRPFCYNDVLNSYQSTMRKKECEEAFDLLLKENYCVLKEYGKAKVFLIN